jgi:integrase
VWSPAPTAVGLPKGTHFHELRHYYASLLIDGSESVKVVQKRLGHGGADETLNTYAHLWPDSEDRTRSVVEAALLRVTGDDSTGGAVTVTRRATAL